MMEHRKPTVPPVAEWVREYRQKPGNALGGSLHIIVDDGNLADNDVEFCRGWARECGDVEGERLAEALLRMSVTQRRKIYRIC